jgi:glycosyltransferase involved in cell wall biosynthesis
MRRFATMSDPPLISVIMPVYNGEPFLRQALDSVFAQTHDRVEVIAVNDGSADRSREILASYGNRVHVIDQQHAGPAAARNRAIAASSGQWLALLDQDDLWEPHRLERQLALARPNDDLLHAECRIIDADGNTIRPKFSTEPCDRHASLARVIRHNPIYVLTVLMRRSAVARVGGLDPANRFGTDDYQLWLRLLATGSRCRYTREVLASYRVHGGNASGDHLQMMRGEIYALTQTYAQHSRGFKGRTLSALRRKLSGLYLSVGCRHAESGDLKEAADCFGLAWRQRPLSWRSGVLSLAARGPLRQRMLPIALRLAGRSGTVSTQDDGWYG